MRRREFITLIGGAAAAWPLAARAQQPAMPLVGVVSGFSEPQMRAPLKAFRLELNRLGWVEGSNPLLDAVTTAAPPSSVMNSRRFIRSPRRRGRSAAAEW